LRDSHHRLSARYVGLWPMSLTVAVVLNTARGFHLPV
jgi:hypothetical protein